jgi:hypothetical protein
MDGFDLPVDEKGDPENRKERFVEPEHAGPPDPRGLGVDDPLLNNYAA